MTTAIPWDIDHLTIMHGSHSAPNGKVQACAMEAAYLRYAARQGWDKKRTVAGWTDSLDCVCPTIGAFVRCWNDNISSDEVRTRIFTPELLDLLPATKGGDALLLRRMWLAIDWDIRTRTPAFLRLAKLERCAVALESLPEICSQEDLANARACCEEAKKEGDAAGVAAWVAAWDTAGDTAGVAAWDTAGDAAGDAAWAAAGDAAWAAAGAAARVAAWAALKPTVEAMQASAVDLLKRMCALKA